MVLANTPSAGRSFKTAAYAHLAEVGKALSSSVRLELLELLAQSALSVEELAGEVQQSIANVSHHLQVLKRAQLVQVKKEGLNRIYSLSSNDVSGLVAQLQRVAGSHLSALQELKKSFFTTRDGLDALAPHELKARLLEGDVVLVDVRPEHEYAEGHLPGSLSIPLAELQTRLNDIPDDKLVVAYCRGPFCTFSADAVRMLRDLGYTAKRFEQGVSDWRAAGNNVVTDVSRGAPVFKSSEKSLPGKNT